MNKLISVVIWLVCTLILMIVGWEAKRYYTRNRSRIIKTAKAAKWTWEKNAPVDAA